MNTTQYEFTKKSNGGGNPLLQSISNAFHYSYEKILQTQLRTMQDIVLVGWSGKTEQILTFLQQRGVFPHYFMPISQTEAGQTMQGMQTISVSDISKFTESRTIFLFSRTDFDLMKALKNRGFRYIDFVWLEYPAMFHYGILMESLDEIAEAFALLEDEDSRKTFLSVLEYRMTADPLRLHIAYWPQYFHPFVRPRTGDVIVDGGAFNGDSAEPFLQSVQGKATIHSFEPDAKNFSSLQEWVRRTKNTESVVPVKAGIWSNSGKLGFAGGQSTASRFVPAVNAEQMEHAIDVISLDDYFARVGGPVSLIKLDVEKSEYEALKGAKQIIGKYLPCLQVCAYHNPWDLWKIPLFVRDMGLKYRFFMGHHTENFCETVLYAMPPEHL